MELGGKLWVTVGRSSSLNLRKDLFPSPKDEDLTNNLVMIDERLFAVQKIRFLF